MTKSYGYGPTRNLTPARENNARIDQGAIGNIHDAVLTLGAALLSKDSALHADLVANNATMFDGWQGFMAGLDDMNTNYGTGGDGVDLAAVGTDLQQNNVIQYNLIIGLHANTFVDAAGLKAGLLALCAELAAWKTGFVDVMTSWALAASYPSEAPVAATPAAAGGSSATIVAEKNAFNTWVIAALTPGLGNVHLGTGDTAGTRVCAVSA